MTSYHLFLLPGDGIGPEVMAEVEKVIKQFQSEGLARFEIEKGLVGGCAYDAHGAAISEDDMARAAGRGRGAAGRGRRPEMGLRSLRGAAGSGAPAPAQGPRPLRQPAAGGLLPGARLGVVAQARGGRGARHHDRPRADRRRLFRRAEADHRPRQRPEARRSTRRSTTPTRSSGSAGSPSTSRASAATR